MMVLDIVFIYNFVHYEASLDYTTNNKGQFVSTDAVKLRGRREALKVQGNW